jgi:uncharacterized membrane protein HdeD (DUF308 family)
MNMRMKNKRGVLVIVALGVIMLAAAVAAAPAADPEEDIVPYDGASIPPGEVFVLLDEAGEQSQNNYDIWLWIIGILVTAFGAVLMFKPNWIKLD